MFWPASLNLYLVLIKIRPPSVPERLKVPGFPRVPRPPPQHSHRYGTAPDNARSVAFSQRSSGPRLIEEETFNDSDIINNLIDYADGQEEPDSLRMFKIIQGSCFPTNYKNIFFTQILIKTGV
ncbi:uncharacterized protein TNCV_1100311 [Trichonephila clavipes]|nr:uncharacterized protein TNCV_1100311 [Trichonephila clavipes]